jgi:hypothetical protein
VHEKALQNIENTVEAIDPQKGIINWSEVKGVLIVNNKIEVFHSLEDKEARKLDLTFNEKIIFTEVW